MAKMDRLALIAGSSVPQLSTTIAGHLNTALIDTDSHRFVDGELSIEINEHIRGRDVYVIQSTCAPVNDYLMELVLLADAVMRSAARSITAIIPYFGYARQDRLPASHRMPISAKVVADIISQIAKARQVVTLDIHSRQIQGFFTIPTININTAPLMVADIWKRDIENIMIVSPDAGGVERARRVARDLETDLAVIDKRRPKANVAEVMNVLGDVRNRHCVIVDDLVDTAGTLCKAASALKNRGALTVAAYCTHPVLSGPAVDRIKESALDELVVNDTIPLQRNAQHVDKIRVLSVAGLMAEIIRRIHTDESVSSIIL